jgi:hypothetical protein
MNFISLYYLNILNLSLAFESLVVEFSSIFVAEKFVHLYEALKISHCARPFLQGSVKNGIRIFVFFLKLNLEQHNTIMMKK